MGVVTCKHNLFFQVTLIWSVAQWCLQVFVFIKSHFEPSNLSRMKSFQLYFLLLQSSLMVWRSLECRPPRRGKLGRCSDIPVAVWSTPKWLHWTTAAPLSGNVSIPQCRWKASCESNRVFSLAALTLSYLTFLCPSSFLILVSCRLL